MLRAYTAGSVPRFAKGVGATTHGAWGWGYRYSPLMHEVREVLVDAVYMDREASLQLTAEGADDVGPWFCLLHAHMLVPIVTLVCCVSSADDLDLEGLGPAAAVVTYYEDRVPFFRRSQALNRERLKLLTLTDRLRDAIQAMDEQMQQLR